MNDELRRPLQDLADALHRAIEGSWEVEEALEAIRATGFGASLLLEVTVALNRQSGTDDGASVLGLESAADDEPRGGEPLPVMPADADFLRSLRISID